MILETIIAAALVAPVEIPDNRVRAYVNPVRVVWTNDGQSRFGNRCAVKHTENLLKPKLGQVPEGSWKWGSDKYGCVMTSNGESPAIILDYGREMHGGIALAFWGSNRDMKVRLRFGESVTETMSQIGERGSSNDHAMRDFELPVPSGGSIEIGNTGFRFVRIDLVTNGKIVINSARAISLMRPMKRLGDFRCNDERINQIWDTAVRTVHLCCQNYLWDGIKRDRLVWMGDTHPETMGILAVFGAASVLPESLDYMAATTTPQEWMNTMPTYTFWWIRNLAEWYRFTGDKVYLAKYSDYLTKTLDHVMTGFGTNGLWTAGNFLDWPTRHNEAASTAGTQGLALSTACEAEYLGNELGNATLVEKARAMAARIKKLRVEPCGAKSSAAMLALSGLRSPREMYNEELGKYGLDKVSTFYGYYMLEAMSAAGENGHALSTVRDYWGAMLDMGATSFFEDFNVAWTNNAFRIDQLPVEGKKDIHGDFGEFCYPGFRHSLCHGWSCGPSSWLIHHVLGIEVLATGCKKVSVKPFLGDLEWAEGAMALPTGESVKVKVTKKANGELDVKIDAPAWVEIVR